MFSLRKQNAEFFKKYRELPEQFDSFEKSDAYYSCLDNLEVGDVIWFYTNKYKQYCSYRTECIDKATIAGVFLTSNSKEILAGSYTEVNGFWIPDNFTINRIKSVNGIVFPFCLWVSGSDILIQKLRNAEVKKPAKSNFFSKTS